MIMHNNGQLMETIYALIYFAIDQFPADTFEGKGLLPLAEHQLVRFRREPRPSKFHRL